jgi:hypothetical protein
MPIEREKAYLEEDDCSISRESALSPPAASPMRLPVRGGLAMLAQYVFKIYFRS